MQQFLIAAKGSGSTPRSAPAKFLDFTFLVVVLLAAWMLPPLSVAAQESGSAMKEVRLAADSFIRSRELPAWARPSPIIPEGMPESSVVMRLAETQLRVADRPETFIRRVLAVNEASGLSAVGQHQIVFQPDYQQIRLHGVRILRGRQAIEQLEEVKVRFVQRERDEDNAIFTGWVTAIVMAEDLRVGDSLEIAYSIVGDNPVFKGKFFDAAQWDSVLPVLLRSVVVDAPQNRSIQYRLIGGGPSGALRPEETVASGRRLLRFEGRNLPPVDIDPYIPADASPLRWLQFSEFRTWRDVAQWAADLFPTPPLPAAFNPLLAELRNQANEIDRLMKALAFVQNEIRYVSLSLGENSHRPFSPSEVFNRRYGDCKDKSLLLVSLLRQTGVEADPVLLSTQYRQNLDSFLPSPLNFNHVIVRVRAGGRTYFLDPTLRSQFGHPGRIGQAHGGTQMLVVDRRADQISLIPAADDVVITSRRRERVNVGKIGEPSTMEVQMEYAGLAAEAMRGAIAGLRPEQFRKHYAGALDRRYAGTELIGEPLVKDDRENSRVTIELHYRIPRIVETDANGWYVPYQASNLTELFYVPTNARRTQPLALPSYPMIGEYEFELTLPEDFDAQRRPYHREVGAGPVAFVQDLSLKGRTARARVSLQIRSDRIETSQVPKFLEDLRNSNGILRSVFAFDKGDMKTTQARQSFKQATRESFERVIRSTTDAIANGRLSGRDLSSSYCERGLAHAYLGRRQEARSDAAEALQRQPNIVSMLKCSGTIEYLVGNLTTSHENLSRAITLGVADMDTRFQRGLVAYYQSRFGDAAEDFEAARKAADTALLATRAEYWRQLSRKRAGLPVTPADLPKGEWPAPAIRLLSGEITVQEVLDQAHQQTTLVSDIALTEAYLYVGQHYLLKGEKFKALAYFSQAAEKEALQSLLYHAIARERAQLNP